MWASITCTCRRADRARDGPVTLLCFEADEDTCHRQLVLDAVRDLVRGRRAHTSQEPLGHELPADPDGVHAAGTRRRPESPGQRHRPVDRDLAHRCTAGSQPVVDRPPLGMAGAFPLSGGRASEPVNWVATVATACRDA